MIDKELLSSAKLSDTRILFEKSLNKLIISKSAANKRKELVDDVGKDIPVRLFFILLFEPTVPLNIRLWTILFLLMVVQASLRFFFLFVNFSRIYHLVCFSWGDIGLYGNFFYVFDWFCLVARKLICIPDNRAKVGIRRPKARELRVSKVTVWEKYWNHILCFVNLIL